MWEDLELFVLIGGNWALKWRVIPKLNAALD
jgi:hypothetical protein